jgi:Skp family chaperone for outer membrane proteins
MKLCNRLLPLAALALFFVVPSARAQEALHIGVCNPAKVFDGMDERKVVQDRMKVDRDRLQGEAARRKQELEEMKKDLGMLQPGSAIHNDKSNELMKKAVDFEVWARLAQAEMDRKEKEQVKGLYDKIQAAAKDVAIDKKLDLVLAEHQPQIPPDMTAITPDQLRQLISANDVLYKNEKADITQAVIVAVNKSYAAGAAAPDKKP